MIYPTLIVHSPSFQHAFYPVIIKGIIKGSLLLLLLLLLLFLLLLPRP